SARPCGFSVWWVGWWLGRFSPAMSYRRLPVNSRRNRRDDRAGSALQRVSAANSDRCQVLQFAAELGVERVGPAATHQDGQPDQLPEQRILPAAALRSS